MRKLSFLVLVFAILLTLTGCGVVPLLPEESEPPLDLLKEYTGQDNVIRWSDGTVLVYDKEGKSREIWNQINEAIDGPTYFELVETEEEAAIKIVYRDMPGILFKGSGWYKEFKFTTFDMVIYPYATESEIRHACLCMVALHEDKAKEIGVFDDPSIMKLVLWWWYRLEPGFAL